MYAATVHGLWPRELNVWIQYHQIRLSESSDKGHNMHTQEKDGKVQLAVTSTWATTKAEKKSKDASGTATRRTWRDILV